MGSARSNCSRRSSVPALASVMQVQLQPTTCFRHDIQRGRRDFFQNFPGDLSIRQWRARQNDTERQSLTSWPMARAPWSHTWYNRTGKWDTSCNLKSYVPLARDTLISSPRFRKTWSSLSCFSLQFFFPPTFTSVANTHCYDGVDNDAFAPRHNGVWRCS